MIWYITYDAGLSSKLKQPGVGGYWARGGPEEEKNWGIFEFRGRPALPRPTQNESDVRRFKKEYGVGASFVTADVS